MAQREKTWLLHLFLLPSLFFSLCLSISLCLSLYISIDIYRYIYIYIYLSHTHTLSPSLTFFFLSPTLLHTPPHTHTQTLPIKHRDCHNGSLHPHPCEQHRSFGAIGWLMCLYTCHFTCIPLTCVGCLHLYMCVYMCLRTCASVYVQVCLHRCFYVSLSSVNSLSLSTI